MRIDGGGTGWLADLYKWIIYVAPPAPSPSPPPPAPEPCSKCIEYEKQITALNNEINILKSTTATQEGKLDEARKEIKRLEKLFDEQEVFIKEQEDEIGDLTWKNSALQREKMELVEKLNEVKRKLKEGQTNFIKQITDWVGEMLAKIFKDE
jgi:predicted  nucleic acid-binding Zn-ribbon protein